VILDTKRPFKELGNQPKGQADFIEQDGIIFGWSESNCAYERAWWLDKDCPPSPLRDNLRKTRPLPT
jgi:hypothetical protein